MLALFEETGIFIAACRHRTILYAFDMIKSGELYVSSSILINATNLAFVSEQDTPW